jgi:hypothetical protein
MIKVAVLVIQTRCTVNALCLLESKLCLLQQIDLRSR